MQDDKRKLTKWDEFIAQLSKMKKGKQSLRSLINLLVKVGLKLKAADVAAATSASLPPAKGYGTFYEVLRNAKLSAAAKGALTLGYGLFVKWVGDKATKVVEKISKAHAARQLVLEALQYKAGSWSEIVIQPKGGLPEFPPEIEGVLVYIRKIGRDKYVVLCAAPSDRFTFVEIVDLSE